MKLYRPFSVNYLVLSTLYSLIFVISAFSQAETKSKPSIAIMPFSASGNASAGAELTDFLITELGKSSVLTVVDKAKSNAIESEMLKALKDSVDKPTASAIGQKTGAKFLILGSVSEYREKAKTSFVGVVTYEGVVKFNLRAVDSTTAEVVFSQTFEKSGVSLGEAKSGAITGSFGSKAMQDVVTKSLKDAVTSLEKRLGSAPAASSPSGQ